MSETPVESPYKIDLLMEQARSLAADFRSSTGKTLPVSAEIALYDAARLLSLQPVDESVAGIDLTDANDEFRFQVKSRVIFPGAKSAPRIGAINTSGEWTHVLLVIMNEAYEATELFALDRESALTEVSGGKKNAMTVAKFKVLGECLWSHPTEVAE